MQLVPTIRSVRRLTLTLAGLCGFSVLTWAAEPKSPEGKIWAFRQPQAGSLPAVKNQDWVRNPIDAFVLKKLDKVGLKPSPEADRAALIRRVSFDLTGLPPTPAEVDAFVNDQVPDAYERVVNRLLESPRYGEHWAIYWLDLVRFAESEGFKADELRPTAWRYRDYVIRSLNQDKPYDRFIREQLAGDELYPDDSEAQVATGYLRHFPDESNAANLELRRQEILNDITDTTGQVFLGLTLGCARCHDHKFDPISQEDYYKIQAFFAAFKPVDVIVADRAERENYQKQMQDWEAKTAEVRKQMAEVEAPYLGKFMAQRKSRFLKEYQEMYDTPAEKRTPYQEQIASMLAKQLGKDSTALVKTMKSEDKTKWQELSKRMESMATSKPPEIPLAPGFTDVSTTAPMTYLLKRGDWRHKGKEVSPGFISELDERSPNLTASRSETKTTGRRSALADWLTRSENPLTARVMVNRLWQHHFGRGIVGTPGDFGNQGDIPTHPELLDWLAGEFSKRGWSLKEMHRLMVSSATYRQSSQWNVNSATIDPENRLLWHMNRRRLQGETLRDAMLAASGQLNLKMGGPSVFPDLPAEFSSGKYGAWPVTKDVTEHSRRSVYVFVKRNLRYPFFSVFDAPDRNETCSRRNCSTNAPQALLLLNGTVARDQARAFASRVLHEAGSQPDAIVARAYRVALGRTPDAEELVATRRFLSKEAGLLAARINTNNPPSLPTSTPPQTDPGLAAAVVDLCHALLNLNEFMYVD